MSGKGKEPFDPHKKIPPKKKDPQQKLKFPKKSEMRNFQGRKISECIYVKAAGTHVYIPREYLRSNGIKTMEDLSKHEYCDSCFMVPCCMCYKNIAEYIRQEGNELVENETYEGNWVVREHLRDVVRTQILPYYFDKSYLESDWYVLYFGCIDEKLKEWFPGERDDYLVEREERRLRGEVLTPLRCEVVGLVDLPEEIWRCKEPDCVTCKVQAEMILEIKAERKRGW